MSELVETIDEAELAQLEAVARAADTGPWRYVETPRQVYKNQAYTVNIPYVYGPSSNPAIPGSDVVATTAYSDRLMPNDRANMQHVAAFDPPTVLKLIANLRQAKK